MTSTACNRKSIKPEVQPNSYILQKKNDYTPEKACFQQINGCQEWGGLTKGKEDFLGNETFFYVMVKT